MHLLVLSAFRRTRVWNEAMTMLGMSQCTFWCSMLSDPEEDFLCPVEAWRVSMHLLVLSAFRLSMYGTIEDGILKSQCTFWCSVLSDIQPHAHHVRGTVSMHLLVLSAFRLEHTWV